MSQPDAHLNLGRNDPCWCGSGKKYKKCHLAGDLANGASAATTFAPQAARTPGVPPIQQTLRTALSQHQAGRLTEAEELYRTVLRVDSKNVDALHLLGVVVNQAGRPLEAIELISKAIFLKPNFANAFSNLGQVLTESQRLDEAESALHKAIALQPTLAEAHHNLGNVMLARRRDSDAAESYRAAIRCNRGYWQAWNNLGQALGKLQETAEAITCYQTAIQLEANYAAPCNSLGLLLNDLGRHEEAASLARRALAIQPHFPEAHNNLGVILQAQEKLEEAETHYRLAVEQKPDYAEALSNLGGAARVLGRTQDAADLCRQAIKLAPLASDPHHNLGIALSDLGDVPGALRSYDRALELKPESALYHWSRALALLVSGDFDGGWDEYEWRWKCKELKPQRMKLAEPEWDGCDPAGKTVFLHCEQGLGDAIQFVRYAGPLAERGAKVIVGCHAPLRTLIATVGGVAATWIDSEPMPAIDYQLSLLSVPRVMKTRLDTIPSHVPYLHADHTRAAAWRERLSTIQSRLKVGLVWAGNRQHQNDRNRSATLASYAPLAQVAGITFVSLQKGEAAAEAMNPPAGMKLLDLSAEITDFMDTAAQIAALDLVITVDTSVAHLAGAMGKPVWTLLPFAPDWRWMIDREDSPWYPTMRLFRRAADGSWETLLARVAEQLGRLAIDQASRALWPIRK